MAENPKNLEENYNETIEGFADLFDEVETDETEESELNLSTSPRDKYTVVGNIDEGGMKKILQIEDSDTTRTLAMAVIKDDKKGERAVQRFVYEARITALLQHPNIVPVHDIGTNSDGEPYFTMKLISGVNLMTILLKLDDEDKAYMQAYSLPELLTIFLKTCDALAYAHSKDVIHLDMKPDNIQVSDFGEVLVVDWGLAKILHNPFDDKEDDFDDVIDSVELTLNGFIKGTPGYMAPEQALGRNQEKTKLTDIYSLGAILYSILTLKKPFNEKDLEIICERTIKGDILPPRERAPERNIPPALEAVCLKAMAIDPAKRYQSVEHLIAEINAYTAGFSTTAEEASYFKELTLLIKRHKAISALIIAGFIISFLFIIQLKENEQTILKTVEDLKVEKSSRVQVSKLAAPRILNEAESHIDLLDFEKALTSATLSSELDPEYSKAWLVKGRLHFGLQEFEEANKALKICTLPEAEDYMLLIQQYGRKFNDLSTEEILELIQELNRIDSDDHITIQLFHFLNTQDNAITRKMSIVGKALEVLNAPGEEFRFECFFYEDGKMDLNLNSSWKINNIKPLAGLPVTHIGIKDTSVEDIRILSTLPLRVADLSYAPVKDISSLSNMNLSELYIRGTRVNQLEALRSMRQLNKLEVDQNTSTILEVLVALNDSEKIVINESPLSILKHKYRSKLLQMREN